MTFVYIVDGARTPFLKAKSGVGPFTAADLSVQTARQLLMRQPFQPSDLNEVIAGCAMPNENEANIARILALRLGCGYKVPAYTVQRNCASGMQALDAGRRSILLGQADLVLAGGVDAMSRAPILFNEKMANWLGAWMNARTSTAKMNVLSQFRFGFLSPVIALLKGLTDPVVGLSMGQTAEKLAYRFDITRTEMDEFAARSHQRLLAAQQGNLLSEITPMIDDKGRLYAEDDGVRADSTVDKLAKLKPFFDKKYGNVTAGNSSQITDGACYLLLASEKAVRRYGLAVRGKIIDCQWAGLDPSVMGLGPVYASTALLQKQGLNKTDIDYWEINEAFAAQVIGCLRAWTSPKFCRDVLGLDSVFGEIPADRLNVQGGAISIGHPIGASGARVVLHLLNVLEQNRARRGIASLCIGGGQGGAMLVEAVA